MVIAIGNYPHSSPTTCYQVYHVSASRNLAGSIYTKAYQLEHYVSQLLLFLACSYLSPIMGLTLLFYSWLCTGAGVTTQHIIYRLDAVSSKNRYIY